ncbi:hypothetical protein CZP2022_20 [Vibrio phage C-ZP2022]|nr:hypothetical protein CZP2022_20 [Vibrio phage C-ZP2022]
MTTVAPKSRIVHTIILKVTDLLSIVESGGLTYCKLGGERLVVRKERTPNGTIYKAIHSVEFKTDSTEEELRDIFTPIAEFITKLENDGYDCEMLTSNY